MEAFHKSELQLVADIKMSIGSAKRLSDSEANELIATTMEHLLQPLAVDVDASVANYRKAL